MSENHIHISMEEGQIKELFEQLRLTRESLCMDGSVIQSLFFYNKKFPDLEYVLSMKIHEKPLED